MNLRTTSSESPVNEVWPPLQSSAAAADADACTPIELCGWLLQLHGSVRMAEFLDLVAVPPTPERRDGQEQLSWRWRLRAVELTATRTLRDPFHGRYAMADTPITYAVLLDGGLPRTPSALAAAADEIAGEFHRGIGQRISIARGGTEQVREQLAADLRRLGEAAAYLERLDNNLRQATEARARQLFERIPLQLHRRFVARLQAAIAALPEAWTSRDLEPWHAPGGWMRQHIAMCRDAIVAVCRHEARALEGLVTAAEELATETLISEGQDA